MGDGVKYLHGMKQTLQRPVAGPYVGVAWAVLGALALLLLGGVCYAVARRRKIRRARWETFRRKVARLDLQPQQQGTLEQLARLECDAEPMKVVENIDVFENAVEAYLGRNGHAPGAVAVLHALRARLGFLTPPGVVYYSTRELEPGQRVRPVFFTGRETIAARARVGTVREDALKLVDVTPPPTESLRGEGAEAVVETPAGTVSFKTEVLDLDRASASCITAHALAVKRAGQRRFHRVALERPVAWQVSDGDRRRRGTLVDLSAGGASLRLPEGERLRRGDRLVLHLQPGRYLRRPAKAKAADLDDRRIGASVVQVERTRGGGRLYHVEFRDAHPEEERYLFRLVNALERERDA